MYVCIYNHIACRDQLKKIYHNPISTIAYYINTCITLLYSCVTLLYSCLTLYSCITSLYSCITLLYSCVTLLYSFLTSLYSCRNIQHSCMIRHQYTAQRCSWRLCFMTQSDKYLFATELQQCQLKMLFVFMDTLVDYPPRREFYPARREIVVCID